MSWRQTPGGIYCGRGVLNEGSKVPKLHGTSGWRMFLTFERFFNSKIIV